jgi:hypothetical protein
MTLRAGATLALIAALLAASSAAWAGAAPAAPPAPAASADATAAVQPMRLRIRLDPGDVRLFERVVRTESEIHSDQGSQKATSEIAVRQEDVVVAWDAEKKIAKLVVLESPSPERLVALEINGKDRLSDYTEQARLRQLKPVLLTQLRGACGEFADRLPPVDNPLSLIDLLYLEMMVLPSDPVKPGDAWTREVDYGLAKARIVTRFTGLKAEGDKGVACAVLDASATVTFGKEYAQRLRFEKLEIQTLAATDGTGILSCSGTISLIDKSEKTESRLTRGFQEKLAQSARLDAPQLDKVRGHLVQIEKAIEQARANDLEGALATVDEYLKDNAQGGWGPAVQSFRDSVMEQLILKKPMVPFRMRLVLRELQAERDRQVSQSNTALADEVEKTLRLVVRANAKTLLADVTDPDPVVRDMAAFGLAFLPDPQAALALAKMAGDASAQVRGSAVIGLTIMGQPLDAPSLATLLTDTDARVKGATALLSARTVKKEDPVADQILPLLVQNLKAATPWARASTVSAIGVLTSTASAPAAAAALVAACKEEKETRLQPMYLATLKTLTGKDATSIEPYEEWVKQHPSKPLEPVEIEKMTPAAPVAAGTTTATTTGSTTGTMTGTTTGTMTSTTTGPIMPTMGPVLPPLKLPGVVAPPPITSLPQPKLPGVVVPPLTPSPLPEPKMPDMVVPPPFPSWTPKTPGAVTPPPASADSDGSKTPDAKKDAAKSE